MVTGQYKMNWGIVVFVALVGLMLVPGTIGQYDIPNTETGDRILKCIGISYTNDDREGGLKCFDGAIALDPTSAPAWVEKGHLLALMDRYDESIQCYQKATQLDPNAPEAWKALAVGWMTYASYMDAETEADKAVQFSRYGEAIKAYDTAIQLAAASSILDPHWDANLWLGKGGALLDQGKYDEAIQSYKKAINLEPDQSDPLVALGHVLVKQGKLDEAMSEFDKAIALNYPYGASKGWNGKGDTYVALGKYDEAIQSYVKAADLAGLEEWGVLDISKFFDLGMTLEYNLHKYDEAIKCFDIIIARQPSYAMGWKCKGDVLKAQGKTTEATAAYAQATKLGYKQEPTA
jgi:tetratricopeptide (TPR) repeat protein